jgi:dUTP pyrophosphatase
MLLTAAEAAKHIKESEYSKRTQAGIDLSAMTIKKYVGEKLPMLLKDRTIIQSENYEDVLKIQIDGYKGWYLQPGVYSVTFNEGISVPSDAQAKVTNRSSIYRIGNAIESPWWDAGFACDNMNTTMIVHSSFFVEENARLAQVVFWRMESEAAELYNGQWKGLSGATHVEVTGSVTPTPEEEEQNFQTVSIY